MTTEAMSHTVQGMVDLLERRKAVFSPCRRYRYLLESIWDERLGIVAFGLLNPSKADETNVDPTNTRCRRYAEAWGYGGLRFWNLFAWRDTDPRNMLRAADPVGPDNDEAILQQCSGAAIIVCGWGNHGTHRDRDQAAMQLLSAAGHELHVLRITKSGHPAHPLYLPAALTPRRWFAGAARLGASDEP